MHAYSSTLDIDGVEAKAVEAKAVDAHEKVGSANVSVVPKTTVANTHRLPPSWKRDPRYVYIGRPSKWANPASHLPSKFATVRVASREAAIDYYVRSHLAAHPELVEAARRELPGKVLVCYCSPLPCHGDVLARIANGAAP